jgi:hypothetical protein
MGGGEGGAGGRGDGGPGEGGGGVGGGLGHAGPDTLYCSEPVHCPTHEPFKRTESVMFVGFK